MDYASTLPREVLVRIFSGLTLQTDSVRNLCSSASVCPTWREAAKEPCLWSKLWVTEAPLNARLIGLRLQNLVARSCNTLSHLRLKGCRVVNDAALALSVQQQPLVYVTIQACALITRPSLAYALCYREDFQGIVAQLNDPRQSVADAQRCCVTLKALFDAPEEAAALGDAQEAGVLSALLHCAALHVPHVRVQAACCSALLTYVIAAQRTEISSYPLIFQASLAALKAHPLDVDAQGASLSLGIVCCYGLEGTPGVPALLDAFPPILAAMRAFPTDLEVQRCGCASLAMMCRLDACVAEAVAAAGAMGLFIKALNLDIIPDAERVAVVSLEAIGAIALSLAALPQASAGISAALSALRLHETSSAVALAACKTLGCYLRSPATRQRALLSGADFGVKAARAAHKTNSAVKNAARDALLGPHA